MAIQIVTDNGADLLPQFEQADVRKGIIDSMASDLVAATTGGLDLTDARDVALYLYDAHRYSQRALRLYTEAAVQAAKETIALAEMGAPQ